MLVSSETPDRQPGRRMYVCPGCKTQIPFGTETSEPPDNCPKCRRRLYIPTIMGEVTYGGVRDVREDQTEEQALATAPNKRISLRTLLIATTLIAVGLGLVAWFTH